VVHHQGDEGGNGACPAGLNRALFIKTVVPLVKNGAQRSLELLELAIFQIGIFGRHPAENCLSHEIFAVHHLLNFANDSFRLFLWDDDYAVDIGKDNVTRPDLDALDLNRLSSRFEPPSASDVPWCSEPGKYRETELSDKRIIPASAVDNITPHAPEMKAFRGELAHKSEAVILWLANNDMPFGRSGQEFSPSNHALMHTARWIGSPLHCEHTPC
jgi:hypothetical protein